jgi:tetratricopeptide (TPR) repeat protein
MPPRRAVLSSALVVLAGLLVSVTAACAQTPAIDSGPAASQIRAGLDAFSGNRFEEAASSFEAANRIDPNNPEILLLLGSAYAASVVPGTSPHLQSAIDALNQVLRLAPDDGYALREMASIEYNLQHYEKAKEIELRILALEPGDFEADYIIAALDFEMASDVDPTAPLAVCRRIATVNLPLLDDAKHRLEHLLSVYPTNDTLEYLSQVAELHAANRCGDPAGRAADRAASAKYANQTLTGAAGLRTAYNLQGDSPQPPSHLTLPREIALVAIPPPPPPVPPSPPPPPPPPGE